MKSVMLSPMKHCQSELSQQHGAVPAVRMRISFIWTAFGNIVYAACQWAMIVALAKFCSSQQVGEFALALAVTGPIFMFTNLQLRSVQATDAKQEYTFSHYVALRFATTFLAFLLIVGLVFWSGYRSETMWVVLAMGLAKGIESISDIVYGLLQQHERLDWIAQSMIIKGFLSAGLLFITVLMTGSPLCGIIAMLGSWATVLVLYDVPCGIRILTTRINNRCLMRFPFALHMPRWKNIHADYRILGHLAWLAIPLGLVSMFSSLYVNIPRYFIETKLGSNNLGIFAALSAVFSALFFVQVAMGAVTLPRLARYYASGMICPYLRMAGVVVGSGLATGLVAVAIAAIGGSRLLRFLYSEEFSRFDQLFFWLSIASLAHCLSSAFDFLLQASRRYKESASICIVKTLLILFCSAWFIPTAGLNGAAFAMLVASLVSIVLYVIRVIDLLKNIKHQSLSANSTLSAPMKKAA
jgi:O-antigen/teichoic acid export membrane protein